MPLIQPLLTWLSELLTSPAFWLLAPMLVAQTVVERRDRRRRPK